MLLTLLKLLFGNIPLIISVVKLVESTFPDSPGKEKLDHALSLISGLVAAAPDAGPHIQAVKDAAAPLVSMAVSVLNASGVFSHNVAAPAALVSAAAPAAVAPSPLQGLNL